MGVGAARGVELDDPRSFSLSTAGLWTRRRLRRPLIDWPVRVRRCAHGQHEPRCPTRVNKCLLGPPGKLPSSQQSPPSTDRIGQDELIHKTATWLLDLHHAGFWPWMDLRDFVSSWCVSLSPSLSIRQGLSDLAGVHSHFTQNWHFVWRRTGRRGFKKLSLWRILCLFLYLSIYLSGGKNALSPRRPLLEYNKSLRSHLANLRQEN